MARPTLVACCLLLLGLAAPAAAWAQQPAPPQNPPDTKPARERHRVQEKEPPPPQGPWGPEDFGFTWHNPVWRGLIFNVGPYGGGSMSLGVPDGVQVAGDGVNPPVSERLVWDNQSFRTTAFTVTTDLDMFRLSASFFHGTFDAEGEFIRDNVVTPFRSLVEFDGDAYGFRLGIHWPALRYRDTLLELSVGPIATVGWLHEETNEIPGGMLLTRDAVDVLTGSLGPKASARLLLGKYEVELNAEYSFMTGAVRGWTKEFSVGVGIHF